MTRDSEALAIVQELVDAQARNDVEGYRRLTAALSMEKTCDALAKAIAIIVVLSAPTPQDVGEAR